MNEPVFLWQEGLRFYQSLPEDTKKRMATVLQPLGAAAHWKQVCRGKKPEETDKKRDDEVMMAFIMLGNAFEAAPQVKQALPILLGDRFANWQSLSSHVAVRMGLHRKNPFLEKDHGKS